MQVLNLPAIAANPTTTTTPAPTAVNSSSSITNPNAPGSLTNETTFLQLLMAQVQNQDPMNPTDSTQFVGQLVQFSSLEQLLGINQGVQTLDAKATAPATTPTPTTPAPITTPGSINRSNLLTQ